ncbi:MAG: hypothetical protein OP8BY_0114 [Candidatus Saccharicenans subterraneus]|uniref:Uncharacterized protein n=1 Tax=Candidatus Saccharicenans subterraneus TaxID=2508984 RepID=A0A3E2BLV7_9BACT|nr:MAG: hypothetical protein OP8BY_0114 [Candidatus Saccharicenans subterraneum]
MAPASRMRNQGKADLDHQPASELWLLARVCRKISGTGIGLVPRKVISGV